MIQRHEVPTNTHDNLLSLLIPPSTRPSLPSQTGDLTPHADSPTTAIADPWDTRLAPFSPAALRSIRTSTFHLTRADPKTLNNAMAAALATGDPVAMSCAWVRCKLLQLPVADYAALTGLRPNTIRSLERGPGTHTPKRELATYSTVGEVWQTLARESAARNPVLATDLQQAREAFLNSLPGADATSTFGVLHRWRYEVGELRFTHALGCSYKNLWARRKQGALFDAHELLQIGKELKLLPSSTSAIFASPTYTTLHAAWLRDCETLGRPRSVAMLHMLLALAYIHIMGNSLHDHPEIRISMRTSEKVARFSQVSWEDLAPVISFLRSTAVLTEGGAEELALREQFTQDSRVHSDSFEARLRELSQRQGMDTSRLTDIFGLRAPDRHKAALPMYRALHYGEYQRSVPPGVLALVLASSREEALDLINLKRREIGDALVREGRRVSRLLVERKLWKIDYADLSYGKDEIQALEWGKPCALDEGEVVRSALRVGLERTQVILSRWHRLHDHSSIRSTIAALLYETPQAALEEQLQSSARRLKSIAVGGEVPPLPTTTRLLGQEEGPLPSHLVRDWFDSFAKFQAGVNQTDLERLLATFVASRSDTLGGYLESRGLSRQTGARIFSAISSCGTVPANDLETLTHALGIEPGSPFHTLLSIVRVAGTIAEATPLFAGALQQRGDSTLADLTALTRAYASDHRSQRRSQRGEISLGELLDIRHGDAPAPKPLRGEASFMECLHNLPGLTAQELRSIAQASTSSAPARAPSHLIRELLERAHDRGISQDEIVFALQRSVPVARQSGYQTSRALAIPLATPLTAPGVLAHLVSADDAELTQWLTTCREQARAELLAVGLKATPLQVEMRVWGIRNDDVPIERHDFGSILWDSSAHSELAKSTVQLVAELGTTKVANTLERFIAGRCATLIPDLSQMLIERHPSGVKGLSIDGHLPLGAAARFAQGTAVPNSRQLKDMARSCSFTLSAPHWISHHFAQAEQIAAEVASPLARFLTHLAVSTFDRSTTWPEKKSLKLQAYTYLLSQAGLPTAKNLALLRNPDPDEAALWKLTTRILHGLGHSESSPLYDFALCLYISDDVPAALARWGKGLQAVTNPFPDVAPLRAFCSELVAPSGLTSSVTTLPELLRTKEQTLTTTLEDVTLQKVLELAHLFPGARISDLVEVPEQSHYAAVFATLQTRAAQRAATDRTTPPTRTALARHVARAARDDEEKTVQDESKALAASLRAREREQTLVRRLSETLGDTTHLHPDAATINDWADALASIMKKPQVADLPRRYTSLLLAVREAPRHKLSYETAFVRKVLELLDRDDRLKGRSDGDSGPKVYSLNL